MHFSIEVCDSRHSGCLLQVEAPTNTRLIYCLPCNWLFIVEVAGKRERGNGRERFSFITRSRLHEEEAIKSLV